MFCFKLFMIWVFFNSVIFGLIHHAIRGVAGVAHHAIHAVRGLGHAILGDEESKLSKKSFVVTKIFDFIKYKNKYKNNIFLSRS